MPGRPVLGGDGGVDHGLPIAHHRFEVSFIVAARSARFSREVSREVVREGERLVFSTGLVTGSCRGPSRRTTSLSAKTTSTGAGRYGSPSVSQGTFWCCRMMIGANRRPAPARGLFLAEKSSRLYDEQRGQAENEHRGEARWEGSRESRSSRGAVATCSAHGLG